MPTRSSRTSQGRSTTLLVGDDGYFSVQAAIDAARDGETIRVAPGTYHETYLVVDKSVTLQGVAEDGTPITDRDEIAASIIAQPGSEYGPCVVIAAPGVTLRGLAFVPASPRCRSIPSVFEVYGEHFRLLASVIERDASARTLTAVHFRRRGECGPPRNAVITGSALHGSICVEGAMPEESASIVIRDNDVLGDLLPPVWISCTSSVLTGAQAEIAMPVLEDNTLATRHRAGFSLVVQCEDADGSNVFTHHLLDAYLNQVLAANNDISAALLARDGDTLIYSGRGDVSWPASPVEMQLIAACRP